MGWYRGQHHKSMITVRLFATSWPALFSLRIDLGVNRTWAQISGCGQHEGCNAAVLLSHKCHQSDAACGASGSDGHGSTMARLSAADLWHPRKKSELSSQLALDWLRQLLDAFLDGLLDMFWCCSDFSRST